MAAIPYIISGTVLDDDNVTPRANISLTAKNMRTFREISTNTDASGNFAIDCANFTDSYEDLDFVLISTNSTGNNGQDLRLRIICNALGQINEIKTEYTTRS